jgi:hypothetical protein
MHIIGSDSDSSQPPRRRRATSNGISLTADDAAVIKGMIVRGDRYSCIAHWYGGVNQGRIAEIATGQTFPDVVPECQSALPPPGPYATPRELALVIEALANAKRALFSAEQIIQRQARI